MAKPRIPNQKKQYQLLNRRLAAYMAAVRRIYGELNGEAARIAISTGYDGKHPFAWKDYPSTKARVRKLQERFVSQLGGLIMTGTSDEWKRSNLQQDLIVDKVLKAYHTSREDAANERYYRDNSEALQAFQQRKERGMNLSDKLWDQSQAYREELQDTISAAIERGTDAITLSKQISKYLSDFPAMQRDYKEKYGKASKVQNCEYRSIRLARSEINMAYRTAEQTRWKQLDFVVGYEIKMSGAHPAHDVCDELAGKYPKDFKWNGWHPNCYTDKAMVLTNNGWKHFSDVESTDAILSLNPDTRDVEWVKFVARQCYPYSGKMIRFFNKSLECVVTPEHQMVYLSKTKGDIRKMSAIYYRKGNGAFYRTCEHRNPEEKQSIEINGDVWSFDDYCEFMGYWLADGSTQHTTGVALCQKKGEPAWDVMISCLERLGYHYTINEETISFYRSNIVRYLKQFGNAYNKFIPAEILSASKRQMQIFLDAFIKCDGYTRKTKSFVGNRGNVFSSKNDERMYFTTSPHLAGDLCQLLIMLGKRPSFKIKEPVIITKKDGSIIKGNYPCFVISECLSGTATVFDKEMVDYSGNVYDLTLEKNHIMYISYGGKCFWGSNCMCYEVPILKTEDEFYSEDDKPSANEVTDVPQEFKDWVQNNIQRAKSWSTAPYFIQDNTQYVSEEFKVGVYTDEERKFVRKGRTALAMSHIEYLHQLHPEIREVELAAINAYTQPVGPTNRNATSREINRRMRNETEDSYVDIASELISRGIAQLPRVTGEVYRGESMSEAKLKSLYLDNVGQTIRIKSFVSTSTDMDVAEQFISHDGVRKSHKRIILHIYSKNGREIFDISEFNGIFADKNQHECLFDKGTVFYVSPDIEEVNGVIHIKLNEV